MASRRDFLRVMTAALGSGIVVAGCGTPPGASGGGAGGASPNGYRFTQVVGGPNLTLPTVNRSEQLNARALLKTVSNASSSFQSFTGAVDLTNGEQIFFHAVDDQGTLALYRGTLDFTSLVPAVKTIDRVVGQGDTLPDGSTLSGIGIGQASKDGTYVTVFSQEDAAPAIYIGHTETGFQPFARMGDDAPGAAAALGGDFKVVAIDDANNVAFVSSFVPTDSDQNLQGLIFVEEGGVAAPASGVQFSTQDMVPDGLGNSGGIGLFDLSPSGFFVAQITLDGGDDLGGSGITPPDPLAKAISPPALPHSVVVHGKIGQPHTRQIVAAHPNTRINPLLRAIGDPASGASLYGPRLTFSGVPVTVLHQSADHLVLFYGSQVVAESGGRSPAGNTIVSFFPPVCGGSERIFALYVCFETVELVMYDGSNGRSSTILSRGDVIDGRTIDDLAFGLTSNPADLHDRLAMIVTYEDGSSGIVLGVPV